MKDLLILRHCEYASRGLTQSGQEKAQRGAELLAERVSERGYSSILIITSSTRRASETGLIYGTSLIVPVTIEQNDLVYSGRDQEVRLLEVIELIKQNAQDFDLIFLVTHAEYVHELPWFYTDQELGFICTCSAYWYGEGIMIFTDEKRCELFAP